MTNSPLPKTRGITVKQRDIPDDEAFKLFLEGFTEGSRNAMILFDLIMETSDIEEVDWREAGRNLGQALATFDYHPRTGKLFFMDAEKTRRFLGKIKGVELKERVQKAYGLDSNGEPIPGSKLWYVEKLKIIFGLEG